MKRIVKTLLFICLIAVLSCVTVWAQATAQINGTVKDQTGAVLPGAEITATQTDNGITREALTDETGSYILANLPIGPYKVEVGMPGFKTSVQTGIQLGANANPTLNTVLEIGQITDQVEVQANATMVETRSLSVRQVIETQEILELPLNGRNATDLILLAGGAVASGGTSSSRTLSGGVGISVGGLQGTATTYTLDGAMHNNLYDNLNLPIPFPDALQEFSVQTGAQNASQGFLSGAQVGAVTKSGTNSFHGDVFDYMRSDRFQAHSYFSTAKGTQRRHQVGGTLGGPIIANKLFFFGAYQGTFNRQNPSDQVTIIPTPRMVAGDFTEIIKVYTDPTAQTGGCRTTAVNATGTGNVPGQLKGGFVNNRIDPAEFNKTSLKLLSMFPKPENECGEIHWGRPSSSDDGQIIGKVDYQRTSVHSIFGRAMFVTQNRPVPYTMMPEDTRILSVSQGGTDNLGSFYTIGDTYLIGANMVNSFRFAANRSAVHRLGPDFFSIPDLGVKAYSYLPKHSLLSVNGSFSLGGGTESDSTFRTTAFQLSDDVNIVMGSHQVAFGGTISEYRSNTYANVRSPGIFTFTSDFTGLGMGDFLLGKLNSLRQAAPNTLLTSKWYLGTYIQDAWKASPRLTINAGIRWEPFFPQQQRDGHVYSFDYERFEKGIKSTQYLNAPPGMYYPGDPGFPSKAAIYNNWKAVSPRVGLGWDPAGDGKTSIRASYGLSYDFVNGQMMINSVIAPPFGNDITHTPASFEDPWANYPGGNPFPYVLNSNAPFGLFGAFVSMPYDIKTTSVQSWSLTVQRQMPQSIFMSIQYNGSGTRHLWSTYPMNPALYLPGNNCPLPNGTVLSGACSSTTAGNVNERRLLSLQNYSVGKYLGPLDSFDDGGTSNYNGLVISASRRTGRLNLSGNYTWSHCIGGTSQSGGTANVNQGTIYMAVVNGQAVPTDREADYGNCGSDRRHNVHTTAVVQTPQFSNKALRWIASNWKVSNIYGWQTGSYFDVSAGSDVARIGGNTGAQRALQVLANPYAEGKPSGPRDLYLNAAAFAVPATGTLAPNKGRSNIVGPPTWQWDAAVSRSFRVRENRTVEVRVEGYNVTNSFRPENPSTNLTNGTLGQINSAYATRDMQFALKYVF